MNGSKIKRNVIQIRVSTDEKQRIEQTQAAGEWLSVSEMIRDLVDQAAKKQAEKPAMNRKDILTAATEAVTVDRAATHGDVEDNFNAIAAIWTARLGIRITAHQVAIMMMDVKTVRAWSNAAHDDNWIDMAGYAACGGEVSQ